MCCQFSSNECVMSLSMKYPNSRATFTDLALINYSPEPAINYKATTTPLLPKCPINRDKRQFYIVGTFSVIIISRRKVFISVEIEASPISPFMFHQQSRIKGWRLCQGLFKDKRWLDTPFLKKLTHRMVSISKSFGDLFGRTPLIWNDADYPFLNSRTCNFKLSISVG